MGLLEEDEGGVTIDREKMLKVLLDDGRRDTLDPVPVNCAPSPIARVSFRIFTFGLFRSVPERLPSTSACHGYGVCLACIVSRPSTHTVELAHCLDLATVFPFSLSCGSLLEYSCFLVPLEV